MAPRYLRCSGKVKYWRQAKLEESSWLARDIFQSFADFPESYRNEWPDPTCEKEILFLANRLIRWKLKTLHQRSPPPPLAGVVWWLGKSTDARRLIERHVLTFRNFSSCLFRCHCSLNASWTYTAFLFKGATWYIFNCDSKEYFEKCSHHGARWDSSQRT